MQFCENFEETYKNKLKLRHTFCCIKDECVLDFPDISSIKPDCMSKNRICR